MATKRYSGNITVTITYVDAKDKYKATVSAGEQRGTVYVGPPRHLTRSVDSPEAFDDAARAAISFAGDEGLDIQGADWGGGTSVVIHRKKPSHKAKAPRGFTKA